MKLLQINAWSGRLNKPLLDLFVEEDPEILCIQEAIELRGSTGGFFLTIDTIQEALGVDHVFFSPVFGLSFMRRKADFGNCIMSKFPFTKKETIFTRQQYNPKFDISEDDYNIRNMQHVAIKTKKGLVHALNHHGHHSHQHKNGDSETLRQMDQISKYVEKLDGPIILAGDFNLTPKSKSLEKLNHQLINLSIKYGLKTTRTILTNKKEVCDYIFVNDQVKVKKFYASDKVVSDHQALVLEFEV